MVYRPRHWTNVKPTLIQHLVSAGHGMLEHSLRPCLLGSIRQNTAHVVNTKHLYTMFNGIGLIMTVQTKMHLLLAELAHSMIRAMRRMTSAGRRRACRD